MASSNPFSYARYDVTAEDEQTLLTAFDTPTALIGTETTEEDSIGNATIERVTIYPQTLLHEKKRTPRRPCLSVRTTIGAVAVVVSMICAIVLVASLHKPDTLPGWLPVPTSASSLNVCDYDTPDLEANWCYNDILCWYGNQSRLALYDILIQHPVLQSCTPNSTCNSCSHTDYTILDQTAQTGYQLAHVYDQLYLTGNGLAIHWSNARVATHRFYGGTDTCAFVIFTSDTRTGYLSYTGRYIAVDYSVTSACIRP